MLFLILLACVFTLSQSGTSDVRNTSIKLGARKDVRHQPPGPELVPTWIKHRASESIQVDNDSEIGKPAPCGLNDSSNKRQGRCFTWLFNWYAKRKMADIMDKKLSSMPFFGDGDKNGNGGSGATPAFPSQVAPIMGQASPAMGQANDAMQQAMMFQQKLVQMQPGSLAGGGGGGMPNFANMGFDFRHLPMY